jgi:hypothetical protein
MYIVIIIILIAKKSTAAIRLRYQGYVLKMSK